MDSDLVAEFVDAFTLEWNCLIAEPAGSERGRDSELRATERKIANLVDAISGGMRSIKLKGRLADLEIRKGVLLAERNREAEPLPALHPNIADVYRRKVVSLREALNTADNTEALEAARQLIDQIVVSPPTNGGDPPEVEVIGEFVAVRGASGAGGANTTKPLRNNNVLCALVSSVKAAQRAPLPGGGGSRAKPLTLLPVSPTTLTPR
ncbi:MAG: hypothetical protein EXR09_11975 [Acetobacteraceae bacterium]|nr:hypothetical protein [Acetobacteraceae bacterium]